MAVSFDLSDIEIPVAADGEQKLTHNSDFMAIAKGWDDTVGTINDLIGKLNPIIDKLGWHVDPIPWTDLEAGVVFPLSGNYKRIQANGANCANLDEDGTQQFVYNLGRVSGNLATTRTFRGEAADALIARMGAFALVVEAAGKAISLAKVAFDGVAEVSEEIAVLVEDALVFLAKKLADLSSKLLSRVAGWIGWAKLAWDVARHGIGVVTDFINGIEDVVNGIRALIDLKNTIEGWVEQVKADLADLKNFVDIMRKLPDVGGDVGLADLAPLKLADLRKDVSKIKTSYGDTETDGQGTLGDLQSQMPDEE